VLETIKVEPGDPSPLAGKVVAVMSRLLEHPELVNSDPLRRRMARGDPAEAMADFEALPDAQAYLPDMQARAEMERQK